MSQQHAWAGRFSADPVAALDAINRSVGFDIRMWREDIFGSRAHAEMLQRIGVLTREELTAILNGLDKVAEELEAGTFEVKMIDEDIHMAVERRLTEFIGDPGRKLHTGRSRNDQVATDVRLYTRAACDQLNEKINILLRRIAVLAEEHASDPLPAYTHLQRGMPTTLGHHLLAWGEMLLRDRDRFEDARRRANVSPLGSGACVSSSLPLDRKFTAEYLGFDGVTQNSLDGVSDRDFILDFLFAASTLMTHMSRIGEELVLWSTHEFDFVSLGDAVSTGSSMMPNKKNPDGAELLRGKAGRVYGGLITLFTSLKGIPLTYNKDMQEDKEPLFDAHDTCVLALDMAHAILTDIEFNVERMRAACAGWVNATDFCEALVRTGVPLRTAHEQTGKLVALAVREEKEIEDLPLEQVQEIAPNANTDILSSLGLDDIIANKNVIGGPAPERVKHAARALHQKADAQ